MMSFMRAVIDVPDEIIESIDRLSAAEKRSRASVIREVLSNYVEATKTPDLEAAFGLWKGKAKDGVTYQEEIRNEWD